MRATLCGVLLIGSACSPLQPGDGWSKVHSLGTSGLGVLALDGELVLAFSDRGLDVSSDDGATWSAKGAGLPMLPSETALVLSDRVLLGAEEGVYTSTNHGESFTRTDMGLPTKVSPYALFDTGTTVLLGMNVGSGDPGVEGGLFRSSSRGASWSKSSAGLRQDSSATSFAKLGAALHVSVYGGVTWTTVGQGLPAENPVDLLYAFDGKLYATAFANGDKGVFVAGDAAATWSDFNAGLVVDGRVPRVISMVRHGTRLFALDALGNVWRR